MRLISVLATIGFCSQVSLACTRESLQAATAVYIDAQTNGDPTLLSVAEGVTYAENDVAVDIASGVLSQKLTIDFDRSLYDTTQCATFTEITVSKTPEPYVIHTRMLFDEEDKITDIQSVVTNAGDWAFDAAGHLSWTKQETWDAIAEDKRDTREVIQAAADAYLDSWGDSTVQVPYGTPCARLEGGIYTGGRTPNANTCRMPAFPQPLKVGHRRYVVDEEVGAVDVLNDFPFIDAGKPDGTPSSNFIRVEAGKIRYIHEVTACTTKNCGR